MLDQGGIEAHRRIKAPKKLREQVMHLEQRPEPTRTRAKWILLGSLTTIVCAAVLFVTTLPSFAVREEITLLCQGVPAGVGPVSILADHPQMTSGLREVSDGIPPALEIGKAAQVSASGGEFSLLDPEDELLGNDIEIEISEDILSYWDLFGTEGTMFPLTLKTNDKQSTCVLSMRDDRRHDLQQSQSFK